MDQSPHCQVRTARFHAAAPRDAGETRSSPAPRRSRLWRVPGRNATVGLYEAENPVALHGALTSLAMWKWMDVTVEALATRPQEK
ncbi:muconolactone Delta-isomerase family protein [Streptomyces sp. NPDC056309]|uniref:muconolactone Delta-isomerase family protein n=1 Tax=unclassified Streptomyces TaxID=2593676 RepID=UPI0035D900B2